MTLCIALAMLLPTAVSGMAEPVKQTESASVSSQRVIDFNMPIPNAPADYPQPPLTDNRLFYLQRSMNPNTVVYAANVNGDGSLDPLEPVKVYWRRYNTSGKRKGLSFLERTVAYGVDFEDGDWRCAGYWVYVVSYAKRKACVFMNGDGKPEARVKLNGRDVRLMFGWIQLGDEDATVPDIRYVDVYGMDLKTGQLVQERLKPQ